MAKRKSKTFQLALFPFLSVLICSIGVLTLILVSSVLGQLDNAPRLVVEYAVAQSGVETVGKEITEIDRDISSIQKKSEQEIAQIADAITLIQKEIEKLKTELDRMEQESVRLKVFDDSETLQKYKTNQVSLRSVQLETETILQRIKDQLALLDKLDPDNKLRARENPELEMKVKTNDLEKTKDLVMEAKAIAAQNEKKLGKAKGDLKKLKDQNPGNTVQLLRGGAGVGFSPSFAECTKEGIILHDALNKNKVLDLENFADKYTYQGFLSKAEKREKGAVVLLVRPNGLETFELAKGIAEEEDMTPGFLPLPTNDVEIKLPTEVKEGEE